MNPIQPRPRDGFALPAALLAMIVIGAIVTGGIYVSSQEHRVSVSTDLGAQAMLVAEYGLQHQLARLTGNDLDGLQVGQVYGFGSAPVNNGSSELGTYHVQVLPLGGRTYMVESEGHVVRGPHTAVRRVTSLSRTTSAQLPFEGALTVYGAFNRAGSSRVRGEDYCDPAYAEPGVTALHVDSVTGLLHGKVEAITGDPPVNPYPELNTDTMSKFGDIDLAELIKSATLHYAGNPAAPKGMEPRTTADGLCDPYPSGSPHNWGEPFPDTHSDHVAACTGHYPIIHSAGDMHLDTGRGQGILIVEGNLTILGNFHFEGVVIVTGKFKMEGTGGGSTAPGKILGTVIVHGEGVIETGDDNDLAGNALVQWDSCAVRNAFGGMRIRPFDQRSWVSDSPPLPSGT